MANIKLLDCTLRDGGYINNWEFGQHAIKDILKKLAEARIDYVEVGFLRDCRYRKEAALFNHCAEIRSMLPENKGKTLFTAMALYNQYDIAQLEDYDGQTIDALRITFHDYDINQGLAYIKQVIDKGYKVFVNPINIMGYSDEMILRLLEKVNRIKPYAFSIVDTFGSMMREDLQRIYLLVEHNLDKDIVIGLHLHENLALSYSLAQDFIDMKFGIRKCVIDASMLGMGRAPGNLCIELIADYMNQKQEGDYNVNPLLDAIDDYIVKWKEVEPWGYNMAYALSAKYNLHRNYAEFLLGKGRLRARQINQIMGSIENYKKTAYDEEYIENLYRSFQSNNVDDTVFVKKLCAECTGRQVLILAPGTSILEQECSIRQYIERNDPLIIAANFIPDTIGVDYVFCCNAIRFEMLQERYHNERLIVTSNLLDICAGGENVVNYSDLSLEGEEHCDNSVIMLLRLLRKMAVRSVYVAGFDGYKHEGNDYVLSCMANNHTKGEEENSRIKRYLGRLIQDMEIHFLTATLYRDE